MSPIHRINKLYTHLRHNLQMFSKKNKKEQKPQFNGAFIWILFYQSINFVEVLEQIALKHSPELTLMLQLVAKSVFLLT